MSDYSEGKIYMIYIPGLEEYCYIGSTVQSLSDRLRRHKFTAQHPELYQFASHVFFQAGNEVHIKLLEAVDCETKTELLERERYWLDQYPEAINRKDPICDDVERHERRKAIRLQCYYNKREERMKKHREWIEQNKEKQKEYKKARGAEKLECPTCKKMLARHSMGAHIKIHK